MLQACWEPKLQSHKVQYAAPDMAKMAEAFGSDQRHYTIGLRVDRDARTVRSLQGGDHCQTSLQSRSRKGLQATNFRPRNLDELSVVQALLSHI